MTEQLVVYLFREAFYTMLLVSAPMLVLSLIIGLIIAVFQAATSIQEITLRLFKSSSWPLWRCQRCHG
jgi:flagellar biosynthetic protein FliQ